jgi:ABC-type multidrug transport system ATPase subunit
VALRRLVRRLADEGRTVLISSHVLAELDEMADDAVYLEAGVSAAADRVAATRSSMRDWRIRSLDPQKLSAALTAAGIAAADQRADGPGVLVSLPGDAAAADLLAALVRKKAPITSFAPAVGDLEHTFLDLSGGDAR